MTPHVLARCAMPPSLSEFEMSVRRAPRRAKVLIMLSSLSESGPHALARACGIETRRLHAIMHGRPPSYSEALALVPLGLAVELRTQRGHRIYAITERGRKKARQLTARSARRAVARAVPGHLPPGPDAVVPFPTPLSPSPRE